jgi:uncharacterized protein with GYD domain
MATFLMLSTIGPNGAATLKDHPGRITEVNSEVEAMGVRIVAQYALLGEWDFLNILEAPDALTVAKVAITLGARGTVKTQTIPAIAIADFIDGLA